MSKEVLSGDRLSKIIITLRNQASLEPLRTTTYPATYVLEIAESLEKALADNAVLQTDLKEMIEFARDAQDNAEDCDVEVIWFQNNMPYDLIGKYQTITPPANKEKIKWKTY